MPAATPLEEHVADRLWSAHRVTRNGFELRCLIARLADGSTLVASPLPTMDDATCAAIEAIGPPTVVLASNHFHTLGVAPFRARYPTMRVICADGARARLEKKTGLEYADLGSLALPDGLEVVAPPGLKGGETWLIATGGGQRVWGVCDAFFNLPAHPRGAFGLVTRLGGSAPGLRISRLFKLAGVADKAAWRDWLLARIEAAPPTAIVPAHGRVWAGDVADLSALVRARLD